MLRNLGTLDFGKPCGGTLKACFELDYSCLNV